MISKKKLAAGLAAVASMALIGGSTLASAPASAADALACTVTGSVTVDAPGITNTAAATTGHFNSTTLSCTGPGAGAGNWTVRADFASASETCAADAAGAGHFTGGSGPLGAVSGGNFTFTRVGTAVAVTGQVAVGANSYSFAASLIFVPSNGVCSNPTLTAGTTQAGINAGSTAVVYQT